TPGTLKPPEQAAIPGYSVSSTNPSRVPSLHPVASTGQPSSTTPLQSLSRPSHTSGEGSVFCLHTNPPTPHVTVPAAQTPCLPVSQGPPPPGLPLSMIPSQ